MYSRESSFKTFLPGEKQFFAPPKIHFFPPFRLRSFISRQVSRTFVGNSFFSASFSAFHFQLPLVSRSFGRDFGRLVRLHNRLETSRWIMNLDDCHDDTLVSIMRRTRRASLGNWGWKIRKFCGNYSKHLWSLQFHPRKFKSLSLSLPSNDQRID